MKSQIVANNYGVESFGMYGAGVGGEARVPLNGVTSTQGHRELSSRSKRNPGSMYFHETMVITFIVWTVNAGLYLCYSGSGKHWLHSRDRIKLYWTMKAVFKGFLLSLLTRPIFQNRNLSNRLSQPQLSEVFFDHSIKFPQSCTDSHAWRHILDWSCILFASRSQRLLFVPSYKPRIKSYAFYFTVDVPLLNDFMANVSPLFC